MNESPQILLAAQRYIKGIRNAGKRAYALAYWRWLTGRTGKEPDFQGADISYMAAQAVRLNLDQIIGEMVSQ